jgi:hypothetical protein
LIANTEIDTGTPGLRAKVRVLTQKVGDMTSAYMNYLRCTDTAELATKVYDHLTVYNIYVVVEERCCCLYMCAQNDVTYVRLTNKCDVP